MGFSRKALRSNSNPDYNGKIMGFSIKLNNPDLKRLSKDIVSTQNIRYKSDIPIYRKHVEVVLINLLRCNQGERLLYSRDTSKGYTNIKRYNPQSITVKRLIKVIDLLETQGYLVNSIGTSSGKKENRVPSFIQPTELFLDTFSDIDTLAESIEEQFMDKEECLILRDEHKQLLAYRDNEYTRNARVLVVGLNAVNRGFKFQDKDGVEITNHYCRIFNESFDKGGRFYRAGILQLKNKRTYDRLKVTCNGEAMVEVDYCNLHILLLTLMKGFQYNPNVDLYNKCIPEEWVSPETRYAVKLATNIMLNAKTYNSAASAVKQLLTKVVPESPDSFPKNFKSKDLMNWVYEGHPDLVEFFCNIESTGLELMKVDSDMAHFVTGCFVGEEKPILPIHDSFLVRKSDKMSLVDAMVAALKTVIGRSDITVPLEVAWWDETYKYQTEKFIK